MDETIALVARQFQDIESEPMDAVSMDLRQRVAQDMDERLMRIAFGSRHHRPSTLYVDKYGNYSTVNPKEQEAILRRNRAPFGLIVSS